MKTKIFATVFVMFMVTPFFFCTASASSKAPSEWELHTNSIYEMVPSEITHMETDGGSCCVYLNSDIPKVRVSSAEYALLRVGDSVTVIKNEHNDKFLLNTPKTETYIKDVVKDGKKYYAIVSDGMDERTIRVSSYSIKDTLDFSKRLRIGDDVLIENGEIKGYEYATVSFWGTVYVIALVLLVLFIVSVLTLLMVCISG